MRASSILSLALTAAVLGGCAAGPPGKSHQETASRSAGDTVLPGRDLTLQAPATAAVEIASPVELSRPAPEPRPAQRARIAPKPAPAPLPDPVPEASPAAQGAVPAVAVAEVPAESGPVEEVAVGAGRELAPGKTVTVIPASSGPSSGSEDASWAPVGHTRGMVIEGGRGGRGGTCRPRGGVRGIGIAGRIPIGVPGRRLR